MTSKRAKSPDKYIEITKNSQDRHLTKEEKRMILNVYGVLRKEVQLPVKKAAARAAGFCGVSTSAVFSAKKEFDKNHETKIPDRPLDPLGAASVRHDENNQGDSRNLPELQPSTTEVVKAKIFEMLSISGTTTIESVVEVFQQDPHLPNVDDTLIRHVVKQLNLTSYMSSVVPQPLQLQQSNWDTAIEASETRWEDQAAIAHCDSGDTGEKRENQEVCSFEFHACSGGFKTEVGLETEGVGERGLPTPPEPSPSPAVGSNPGQTYYVVAPDLLEQARPFAGVLVYGLSAGNSASRPPVEPVGSVRPPGFPQFLLACPHCPRTFTAEKDFVQHTMYQHTMRSLACEFCGRLFDSAQRLVRHVASEHMRAFLEQQGVVATLG